MFSIANISAIKVAQEEQANDWVPPGVASSCDAGVQLPMLKKSSSPNYPREAVAAGIEGAVWVQGIVEADGQIRRARVIRPIDFEHGLDAEALNTIRRWRFGAATKDGVPIPYLVTTQVSFRLKDTRP